MVLAAFYFIFYFGCMCIKFTYDTLPFTRKIVNAMQRFYVLKHFDMVMNCIYFVFMRM